jgi:hypothetical protein
VGRTSSSGVLKALYYLAPGVPVVGLLQARRERKSGFQISSVVTEDVVGELESKCVAQPVFCCIMSISPRSRGGSSPFYRSRRERITCAPCYFSYVKGRGVLCCRVGGRPDDPRSDPAIRAYLVPEQWRLRG